ncbi:MAG: cytochrome c3 family protein [Ignavibacteriaceae bacterium]
MKLKYLYLFLLTAVTGLLFSAAFSDIQEAEAEVKGNDKIIKFSHSFHAELAGCADCHAKAAASTSLKDRLMPDHEDCGTCHDVEDSEQCVTCHYEDTYEQLVQNKSELFFNHSFHVTDQKMECESCHKGIKEADYGFQAAQPNPVMADCYSCHNDLTVASNACESCHTSTVNLIPQTHKDVAFIKTHKFEANDVAADCIMCHDNNNNSCQDCHAASGIDVANVPNDFFQPYSPNSFSDGAAKQKLNRVHELNYRFIHGIDAKSKRTDCASCHQVETFCETCHTGENGDYALGGITPASHLKAGFITIGVGTGGGEHARLAKREIESCASCHDTQGADPTCITCHLDSDGIQGTNPKTHPSNFMRDVKGDWHDSQGSMCFNCHTSTIAGAGFCGYCHGSNM